MIRPVRLLRRWRGGNPFRELRVTGFTAASDGEAVLHVIAQAPGTSWATPGSESAVLTIDLDGTYNQDIVLFGGERDFTYSVQLGYVPAGSHSLRLGFDPAKSTPGAAKVEVLDVHVEVVESGDERYLALHHSPIIYGRSLSSPFENNHTDCPLLMYHTCRHDTEQTTIEYTVVFSGEDGGTGRNLAALLARWGHTTDIEWCYRVTLDRTGKVMSEMYHGTDHHTVDFTGRKESSHPLLVIATDYGTFAQWPFSGYRFIMDSSPTLPPGRAREQIMVSNPWTFQLSAWEVIREGRVEMAPEPRSLGATDPRNYLYLEIDKQTECRGRVGVALGVKLRDGEPWYMSDHDVADWSIERDGPSSTAVELPPGTKVEDIEGIKAVAILIKGNGNYVIRFQSLSAAFFLDADYLPQPSFAEWHGEIELTSSRPEALIWPVVR